MAGIGQAPSSSEYKAGTVPDLVKQFVNYFYRHIRERNTREIMMMYETSFATLSERFFKGSSWPPCEYIEDLVDRDHVFCLLYKEMYFRHLYASTQPTLVQRCDSYDNYCSLLNVILVGNVNMQLPNGWLWDMIDEFIYQFQSFQQYRGRLSNKSPEELAMLRKCDNVWSTNSVLNYLQALVDKSGIVAQLSSAGGAERFYASEGYDPHTSNVLRMLGYFSLVGLSRVHALIGDFHTSLEALHPINPFQRKHLYTNKIAGCNITLFYYSGFSYLMLRRYVDAASAFNTILAYIARVKHLHARSGQYDQILKKNEQIYALLALTLAFCPAAAKVLDETVLNSLKEKHGDKMQKMTRGGESAYEELFQYACPKFITPTPPSLDAPSMNTNQEAYRLQWRSFSGLMYERKHLPGLKALLKLYTSISLPKLASLLDGLDESAVRGQLIFLKSTQSCVCWSGEGPATAGKPQIAADIEFFVDIDSNTGVEMVHVADPKPQRRQPEFLVRDIARFEEIVSELASQQHQAPAAAPRRPVATH